MTTQIHTRTTCPRCAGSGVIYDPAWEKWNAQYHAIWTEAVRNGADPFAATDAWWRDHPEPEGEEEPPCLRCHGAGVIEEWQDAPAPAAPPMPREWAEPQIAAFLGHVRAGTIGPYPDDAATARAIADHLWNNWAQIAEARALLGRA